MDSQEELKQWILLYVDSKQYIKLQNLLEDYEMSLTGKYSFIEAEVHLLSYLSQWEVFKARQLSQRLDEKIASQDQIKLLKSLTEFIVQKNYHKLNRTLQNIKQSLINRPGLPQQLTQLYEELNNQAQKQLIIFIQQNYKTIHIDNIRSYFGINGQELLDKIKNLGWQVDNNYVEVTQQQNGEEINKKQQISEIKSLLKSIEEFQ